MEFTQSFKYRLRVTPSIEPHLLSTVGASRFAQNKLLECVQNNWAQIAAEKAASGDESHVTPYVKTGHFDLLRLWSSIRDEVAPWWSEVSSQSFNDAAKRLSAAFATWRAGRGKFPTMRRKGRADSVWFTGGSFGIVDRHHVRLAKIGLVSTYESMRKMVRRVENGSMRITSVRLKRETGGWFVVFTTVMNRADPTPRTTERVIGLDLGLAALITGTTPDGEHVLSVNNPRNYERSEARLAKAQRVASRKQGPAPGKSPSNRWRVANRKVRKIHATIVNQRNNSLHQITSNLVKDWDVIVVEDLNTKGLVRNSKLAKQISDASWGELVRQLEYKAAWAGVTIIKAGRFYPSSKTCSTCGYVKAKLPLKERTYECNNCSTSIDRDVNAALNLARLSIATPVVDIRSAGTDTVAGRGSTQKTNTPTGVEAVACEASTLTTEH
jgi:putative transposase